MNFNDASKVRLVIDAMMDANRPRAENRALIDWLFNGNPPFDEQERIANNAEVNVNFLDATRIAHEARSQWNNAMLKPGNYFTMKPEMGPPHKKIEWGNRATLRINRKLKRSLEYIESWRARGAQVTLHGIGPVKWPNPWTWCPENINIEDLKVPSRTLVSLKNLNHFAIYTQFTASELFRMTHGDHVDKGWNMDLVNKELKKIAEKDEQETSTFTEPEKLVAQFQNNLGFYDSDAVPTIKAWDFFFRNEKSQDGAWHRRIVLTSNPDSSTKDDFLFSPKRIYARNLSEILNIQFADGSCTAPFRYHSIRSLGHLLYATAHLQNRALCRGYETFFENSHMYFRVSNPTDQDRLQKVELQNYGIIPEGLGIVPQTERHQINVQLFNEIISMGKQRMAENAQTFNQDIDTGTQKEMTAHEATMRMTNATSLTSAMFGLAYVYAGFEYNEIVRRFFIKDSPDKDVREFQKECVKDGIPPELFHVEHWTIEPEKVLGAGNKVIEQQQVMKLMQVRNLHDPDAQRVILHLYDEAMTDDPELAEMLTPLNKKPASPAVNLAQNDAATLMAGMPVELRQGINHIDYVESLLKSMQAKIQKIEGTGGMATKDEIIGLGNMAQSIQQHIQIIGQDPNEKQRVKQYGDMLGKFMNLVKAYEQRLQEQEQKEGAAMSAKDRALLQSAAIKSKMDEAKAGQKMRHKDVAFVKDQQRKDLGARADAAARLGKAKVDAVAKDITTSAEVARSRHKSFNEKNGE